MKKRDKKKGEPMKIKVIVHEAEEGGFWAEVAIYSVRIRKLWRPYRARINFGG